MDYSEDFNRALAELSEVIESPSIQGFLELDNVLDKLEMCLCYGTTVGAGRCVGACR